ncbi:MAG: NFACT family protein, partial [Erysipelotrichales bacterium]|nr:NFACT family protein [Erysipelotrichales bacterium]
VRNEIGDLVVSRLYVELMGKYANIILCDEKGKIIDAMKRIPPFENTKRIIVPTAMYTPVEVQDKKDPLGENIQIDDLTPLYKQFHGFSPLLSREFEYRIHNGEKFEDIMHELMSTDRMYFYDLGDSFEYHCLPLLHLDQKAVEYDLMEGFDILYYHKEEKERIRQQTGDLFRFVSKELNKLRSKLLKLRDTLEEAENCEKYRIYGELLYAYGYSIEKGAKKALLPSFEDGELIEIPLDPKFDAKYNAKKMYQKYNKGKNAQVIVAEQIELCKSEIAYFELLQTQLEQATFDDAREIRSELASKGYMKQLVSKVRKKKNTVPAYATYKVGDTLIHVGKNNIQNDYLTWKLAKRDDYWFHVKDMHGSHVIVQGEMSEEVIRAAANLAALFSQGRASSSVPVNYTQVRALKKVPSSATGFVVFHTYKTIYIDPEESLEQTYQRIK